MLSPTPCSRWWCSPCWTSSGSNSPFPVSSSSNISGQFFQPDQPAIDQLGDLLRQFLRALVFGLMRYAEQTPCRAVGEVVELPQVANDVHGDRVAEVGVELLAELADGGNV